MSPAPARIVVTGASGLVGRRLRAALRNRGAELRLISRRARTADDSAERWSTWDELPEAVDGADAVIHLAGEPVAGRRWTRTVRQALFESRVGTTERLVAALSTAEQRPRVLVQSSAVGWYGDRDDALLDEAAAAGEGDLADICRAWEAAAAPVFELGIRVAIARLGVVLDPDGGALGRMVPIFRLGVGGRLGDGRQWMPWIHRDDVTALLLHALDDDGLHGPFNAVAPQPVRNAEFTRVLAAALRRPAVLPVPGFALRLLFGAGAQVLLAGQRAIPAAAQARGWRPEWPELDGALRELLG